MPILGLTITLYNGLQILAISAFVYVLYRFSASYLKFSRSPLRDLPGPPSLSFLRGSFADTSEGNAYRMMEQWAREYSNTFVFRSLLSVSTLCLRIARVICCGTQFSSLHRHRKLLRLMNPAFGPAQVRLLSEVFLQKSLEMRDVLTNKLQATSRKDGKLEVDIFKWLNKVTLDIIGLAGFEYAFDALSNDSDEETNELYEAIRSVQKFNPFQPSFAIQLFFPITRIIPTARSRISAASLKTMRRIGSKLIASKKAEVLGSAGIPHINPDVDAKVGKQDVKGRDLLSLLIKSNMAGDLAEGERMTEEEILAPTILVAGHETTSTALTWTIFALSVQSHIQTKLRSEIMQRPADSPTMDEINSLPYLDGVIREVMRLHAPVAQSERIAVRDCVVPLGGSGSRDKNGVVMDHLRLREGDIVKLPIRAINRSKEIWGEDAEEFKPERWLNDNKSKTEAQVHSVPGVWSNLMSFLSGPHACIGYRFSIVEMKYLLFTMIRSFEFELAISPEDIGRKTSVVGRPFIASNPAAGTQLPVLIRAISETIMS
ncbi:cytochrome P450 [Stereum hirsutum FP-91666 SS1]|uniref:cytochrome P450 n=1 Tax=Stereum hirsutum (strain FP-91666) TaxID=721885 RepID=UPI000440C829|nr:cytochrome P450 [Stereum hirsutum FP-91666 SS1]EIM89578.1 cytochrome P450 [Stereum hirsutum FP-91666 SS1]